MRKEIEGLGFVELVDVMGSDEDIVRAARVSYGVDTKPIDSQSVRRLIRYLMRHHHTSPFEMAEMKFVIQAPIFVMRQWVRHRTANLNEISGRYTKMELGVWQVDPEQIRGQGNGPNKQVGNGILSEQERDSAAEIYDHAFRDSHKAYENLLDVGVSREQARGVLPLATITRWYWKIDLHNLLRFVRLRDSEHAQKEIAVFASAIRDMIKEKFPFTYEAFDDYVLNAIELGYPAQYAFEKFMSIFSGRTLPLLPDDVFLEADKVVRHVMDKFSVTKSEATEAVEAAKDLIVTTMT